ncbi:MAG: alpha/beta hydrolase [Dermatophilaceae bacterium]|jgi:pimeloyl-ACP methyl ester carboxylesterase|nr:alpha/beta hydrolase [Dermatophilaceae bacterium]MBP9918087.1 alpha/beta hydrolase [Dermatophilaceae bacterium]
MPAPPPVHAGAMSVPVNGGDLVVSRLSSAAPSAPTAIALHGITGNGWAWLPVAAGLFGRMSLWAPDLRGRAASRLVGPPYGLGTHADDVIALMDHLELERAVLIGHSMGAWVGSLVAARHPDRVSSLVLVDGGLGTAMPSWVDPDLFMYAVLGPAIQRLGMTFPSPADYLAYWAFHPGLGPTLAGPTGHLVRHYLTRDLVQERGGWRSSCVLDAVRADGSALLDDEEVLTSPQASIGHGIPVSLLWAPRGALNQPMGLYGGAWPPWRPLPEGITAERVPDANHYTVIFDPPAVRQVVSRLLAAAAR